MADDAPSLHTASMHGFLDRWRDGDRGAADELVRRAGDRLRRLATRMYRGFPNVRPLAEPCDVIQESWVRLLATLRNLRPRNTREFFSLAAVHVRRELIDLARKAKTRQLDNTVPLSGGDGSSPGLQLPEPDHGAADLDLWVRFHETVGELSPLHREVVSLAFYHGQSQAQIAALLGHNERTVRRWWADALMELRARVGETLPGS